jgi:hypothetical protein
MSGWASTELQKTIFTVLSGDSQLGPLITGVYDFPPQGTTFPYVTIGWGSETDWGTHTFQGQEHTLMIHTWSRATGRKQARTIMGHIYRILHEKRLSVSGQYMIIMRYEFSDIDIDPDSVTHHGVQRFRVLTKEV